LKTIGHNLKNLGPSTKTLRHPWCPKLVTGLFGHSLKIRAWAKPSDGLAFLTNNHDVILILRWLSMSCSKRNADWILSFNCDRRYFV